MVVWLLGLLAMWLAVDALRTQSYWAKRTTLQWPWYYRVHKDQGSFSYWFYVIAHGLLAAGCFLAPLFITSR